MISLIKATELWQKINRSASKSEPFIFVVDYDMKNAYFSLNPLTDCGIYWKIDGVGNSNFIKEERSIDATLKASPMDYGTYEKAFQSIQNDLQKGNTFLANLTVPTPIECACSLEDIFSRSKSRFKVLIPNHFTCFSPEIFVNVSQNGRIASFPMKGTISGAIPNAEAVILNDYKETCEHHTIVDFIRSDLSRVATNINVERLRYIDRLNTSKGEILQVSSEISGVLPFNWKDELGNIIRELLPAGSISGAPKQATVKAIAEAEIDNRGFYTGVCGYFDGKELKSFVIIRYIEENSDGEKTFRSGGGITINSSCKEEYEEVINKVYLQETQNDR